MDFAIKFDIIKKSGSWFSYNGERIGQGKDNVRKLIESNPEMLAELEEKVRALLSNPQLKGQESLEFELADDENAADDDFDIRLMKLEDDE